MPATFRGLSDRVEKERVLCRGNRTVVSVVEGGRPVVRKRLHDFANVSSERVALYYEALIQRAANGPGVVPIIDKRLSGVERLHEVGEVAIEIEEFERHYVKGHSLRELCLPPHRHHLEQRKCIGWIACVASTLDRIHALQGANDEPLGLVHRDVTWDNILIAEEELHRSTAGEGAYLNDFGLAFIRSWGKLHLDETLQGSTRFLCPELKAGLQPSPACDVYQLALTLCFVLYAGKGLDPRELFENGFSNPVNEKARNLLHPLGVDACLNADPSHRPTAAELAQMLRYALNRPDPKG